MLSNSKRRWSEPPHGAPVPVNPMLPPFVVGASAVDVPRIDASEVLPTAIASTQCRGAITGGHGGHV